MVGTTGGLFFNCHRMPGNPDGNANMPNWRELTHAYGSAEDIPEIISALTPDPTSPAWEELWSRVCHQGTTYSASPAVLPLLLSVASNWSSTDRAMPLALAGSIVAATQTILDGYEETVDGLRTLAHDTVKNPRLSREDRIYVMQSALAFQRDRLWRRVLDHLNDGEFPALCPACRKDLSPAIGCVGLASSGQKSSHWKRTRLPASVNGFIRFPFRATTQNWPIGFATCSGHRSVPSVASRLICRMRSQKSRN